MMNYVRFLAVLIPLFMTAIDVGAQVQVKLVPKPNPAVNSNIVIYNQFFDRPNNKSGWIYDPTSGFDRPFRDLGQSFKTTTPFYLDKVYIAISPYTDQAHFDACENAPFHLDIYTFPSVDNMEQPDATISSQSGTLPGVMVQSESEQYLEFDIVNVPITAGKFFGFLLKFDFMKTNRYMSIVKSEDGDYYPNGRMIYTEFNGTDGRQNITIYLWKHAGGNSNRDLHFWLEKGSPTDVSGAQSTLAPDRFKLWQNYPNPFNEGTVISYNISLKTRVQIDIYNIIGKHVRTLVDEVAPEGFYAVHWNGLDDNKGQLPSGIYYCQMQTEGYTGVKKLIYLR